MSLQSRCQAGGAQWITVEPELSPDGKSPMDRTALSLAGLMKLL